MKGWSVTSTSPYAFMVWRLATVYLSSLRTERGKYLHWGRTVQVTPSAAGAAVAVCGAVAFCSLRSVATLFSFC